MNLAFVDQEKNINDAVVPYNKKIKTDKTITPKTMSGNIIFLDFHI